MEQHVVTYRFVLVASYASTGLSRYRRQHPLLRHYWWLSTVSIVGLLVGIAFFIHVGDFSMLPFAIFFLTIVVASSTSMRGLAQSKLRKSPFYGQTLDIEISDEGLLASCDVGESRFVWKVATKARSFCDGVLIFHGPHAFRWLPDIALVSGSIEQAQSLIRAHVSDYAEVELRRAH